MTEQIFDVNELFEGLKNFDKNLLFMEKGERKFFCLAMPLEYNGKKKIALPVQGYFKGQPNKNPSFLVRCFEVPIQSNGQPDFQNAKFVALVTNGYVAGKIRDCFTAGSALETKPNLLPDSNGKAYLFKLQRIEKNTEFTPSSVSIQIPVDLYQQDNPDWTTLLEEFNGMQVAMTAKYSKDNGAETNKESTPWDN